MQIESQLCTINQLTPDEYVNKLEVKYRTGADTSQLAAQPVGVLGVIISTNKNKVIQQGDVESTS